MSMFCDVHSKSSRSAVCSASYTRIRCDIRTYVRLRSARVSTHHSSSPVWIYMKSWMRRSHEQQMVGWKRRQMSGGCSDGQKEEEKEIILKISIAGNNDMVMDLPCTYALYGMSVPVCALNMLALYWSGMSNEPKERICHLAIVETHNTIIVFGFLISSKKK